MRKFYSILNILVFCFIIYYMTCKPNNEYFKHSVMVMGIISILSALYMIFLEFTDNTEEIKNKQIKKMKETFNSKIKELSGKTSDYETKLKTLKEIEEENKFLVNDLTKANSVIKNMISMKSQDTSEQNKPINKQFNLPNKDINIQQINKENYQFNQIGKPQISPGYNDSENEAYVNSRSDVDTSVMENELNDYKNFQVTEPKKNPALPDFLKPIKTNDKRSSANDY